MATIGNYSSIVPIRTHSCRSLLCLSHFSLSPHRKVMIIKKAAVMYCSAWMTMLLMLCGADAAGQSALVTISGQVKDGNTGAPLAGVNVSILNASRATSTDTHGNYVLTVKPGNHNILYSSVGYTTLIKKVRVSGTEPLIHVNVALDSSIYMLSDVTVQANRESGSQTLDTLKAMDIQNMPTLFSNVLSSIKILPGVTSNNELSSTYNVRGGNFDENLIYLNGYEIFQPYLLQQGIEQSQSIVNENMVNTMEFYHGAFPVHFGDKMSSVLAVKYQNEERSTLGGEVHADLFNMGLTMHDKTGNLSWRAGGRYSYPTLFENTLQTAGAYKPRYNDFQLLGSYSLPDNGEIQLLFITARNTFELTPQSWFGNYQTAYLDVKQVTLKFAGNSKYTFNTNVAALKYIKPLGENSSLTTSLAYYTDAEYYHTDLSYTASYSDDAYHPNDNVLYLETTRKFAENSLATKRLEVMSDYRVKYQRHLIQAGINMRYSTLESSLDKSASYLGVDSVLHTSSDISQKLNTEFNSLSAYVEDNINLSSTLSADAGVRALKCFFNGQFLLSPRVGISFKPDLVNSFTMSWGTYYQPPYFYETWDKILQTAKELKAQKDVQYNLGWVHQIKEHTRFTAEAYYKDLSRRIPYYVDQLQLSYGNKNNFEGYAYGLDLQFEGELVKGMNTWVGYSYLNAEERETPGNYQYKPSPLDQTHTIRIFLQDNARSHPNLQTHVVFQVGTGYRYYPMISVPGTSPGSYEIVPDYTKTRQYPFYFRVDMGLTFEYQIFNKKNIIFTAEVLNVFNHNNVTSYSWFHVSAETTQPVKVANILSPRNFNVGFKLEI